MDALTVTHWTEESADDFLYKIAADFVQQIENYLDATGGTQAGFAAKLGVTAGRVSQVLNNPGNLTLKKCVEYARAIGKKVAVVAYSDNDAANVNGPINAQVFEQCWERAGRPVDVLAMEDSGAVVMYCIRPEPPSHYDMTLRPTLVKGTTPFSSCGIEQEATTDAGSRLDTKSSVFGVINHG